MSPVGSRSSEPARAQSHEHHQHAGIFLGGTKESGESGGSIGLDYEYRLNETFGVGGFVEHTGGELDFTIAAATLLVHPVEHWVLLAGAGFENEDGDNEKLVRLGVAYELLRGDYIVAPGVYVDFVDGRQALIAGVSVGLGF